MASWSSMTKIAGSGSISQRHGSADPDPDPDPHQNVMDPQHWCPPVSLTYLSLLVKGEESVVLCGDLLSQCLAYTFLTISSCPPVSLTYLSLSLSKGKRASTSVETCLHLPNCLCLSTCLSNLPVSLCKFWHIKHNHISGEKIIQMYDVPLFLS